MGILGGTGSAKTTLVSLIPRLYDATEGAVKVGGIDVREYDLNALRNEVSMVLQKNVLFSGTIKENLRWGNENATDEQLKSAPYFRCASMSGLQLDIYNDYIGGEVRLAYYFDGEREIPVTGISISGKLSDALANMRLSDTATVYEGYLGPKWASFGGIEIV